MTNEDGGFAALQWLMLLGGVILAVVFMANLVVVQYSAGAMQSAVDRAARVGELAGHQRDLGR